MNKLIYCPINNGDCTECSKRELKKDCNGNYLGQRRLTPEEYSNNMNLAFYIQDDLYNFCRGYMSGLAVNLSGLNDPKVKSGHEVNLKKLTDRRRGVNVLAQGYYCGFRGMNFKKILESVEVAEERNE